MVTLLYDLLYMRYGQVVKLTCNPVWNCSLYLPVHGRHREQELQVSVWDEAPNRVKRVIIDT